MEPKGSKEPPRNPQGTPMEPQRYPQGTPKQPPRNPKEAFGSLWNPKEPYVFEELHCKTALQKCPPSPPSPPLQSALERKAKAIRAQKY